MADTQTTNYLWTMPEVGAAALTWGDSLNQNMQDIDAKVFAANQGVAPIGSITMFAGVTLPLNSTGSGTNWAFCDGSSKSNVAGTAYAPLFAVIGYAYGGSGTSFNLPNLQGRFPIGKSSSLSLAATGGEATHALTTAELAAHSHTITDTQHTHTAQHVVAQASGGHIGTGSAGQNQITITTDPAFTGLTGTNSTGSGTPHQNMPPYLVVNYIIRFQ